MSKLIGNIIAGFIIVICILVLLAIMGLVINGVQSIWGMIL